MHALHAGPLEKSWNLVHVLSLRLGQAVQKLNGTGLALALLLLELLLIILPLPVVDVASLMIEHGKHVDILM